MRKFRFIAYRNFSRLCDCKQNIRVGRDNRLDISMSVVVFRFAISCAVVKEISIAVFLASLIRDITTNSSALSPSKEASGSSISFSFFTSRFTGAVAFDGNSADANFEYDCMAALKLNTSSGTSFRKFSDGWHNDNEPSILGKRMIQLCRDKKMCH